MKRFATTVALCLALNVSLLGQQPKSQEELDVIRAMYNAATPDERIQAAQKLLTDFKDSDFIELANYSLMAAYQEKDDFENMLLYGERTLSINPNNAGALLSLATAIPIRTREFDLDRDEKLAKAEDFAKQALVLIPNLDKPNPDLPDEQWLMAKKDYMGSAYESLGLVSLKRENFAVAEEQFRKSLEISAQQTAAGFFYLGEALNGQGKKEDAINALDQSISRGDVPLGDGRGAAAVLKAQIQGAAK